ncbi:YdcF family protein [Persicobacter diffluens]|uniref:DUF218 domain-containing protein n=1 Tax=Persicobacter diffluens TaxID=981 RepID=A0AAN5AIR8_9BACT|nr:hypothetical protein PEDI_13270 [Persicobacter diffluens]
MFFLLSKALVFCIQPINWILLFLLLALVWKRKRKTFLLTTFSLFILFSNRPLYDFFDRCWQIDSLEMEDLSLNKPRTAILLGGAVDTGRPPFTLTHFNWAADRITHTLQLFQRGYVHQIILTGGNGYVNRMEGEPSEAMTTAQFLMDAGVPESAIFIEDASRNTYENACFTKALIEAQNVASDTEWLLITSASHMRRSLAIFEKAGLYCLPFSAHYATSHRPLVWTDYLLPDAQTLTCWNFLIKEWVGFVTYRLKGYL